ncbi:MAG: Gfo/Idh/MocA family oxidoreductase [Synoicihabitans sp.]
MTKFPASPRPDNLDTRIGISGSGFIVSDCHLPSYAKAGFNVAAIASRNATNAAKVGAAHNIATVHSSYEALLDDRSLDVLDIAVPPQHQLPLIEAACARGTVKGILAQKPLALDFADAQRAVRVCADAGITLSVNQNMRYDPSVRVASHLLNSGHLGEPVFATIDMRGIPHWQPWQADTGSASLRIMSIHHFDCMRHWLGDPARVYCSTRTDPRTTFPHHDGICTTILEYENGVRAVVIDDVWTGPAREGCPADIRIEWRIEGTEGLAIGEIGWCQDPYTTPSTVRFARKGDPDFTAPELTESWFPDAFADTMGQLLVGLETNELPAINAEDNLHTLALVEAAVTSSKEHRAVNPASFYS